MKEKTRKTTKPNRAKGTRDIEGSRGHLHADADGAFKPGKPLRSPQPSWIWDRVTGPDGRIVASVANSSPDTLTAFKYEASLIDGELRSARAMVQADSDITRFDLRKTLPKLSERIADTELDFLIEKRGCIRSLKKFKVRILAHATGYKEETVERYLKFPHSRQVKKAKKGRPRKIDSRSSHK